MNPKHIGLLALLLLVVGVGAVTWMGGHLHRPLQLAEPDTLEVAPGDGLSRILLNIEQRGLLGDADEARVRKFSARLYDLFTGVAQRIHVGEYRIAPGDSLMVLMEKLEAGAVLQRAFTLVEGWNFRELRQALAGVQGLEHRTADFTDSAIMKKLGAEGVHPEGQFAPDTYFFTRGDSDMALLARAHERQQAILADAWKDRADNLPYENAYQALVMASIVEKETGAGRSYQQLQDAN